MDSMKKGFKIETQNLSFTFMRTIPPPRSRRYRQQTNDILTLELRLQTFANVIEMFVMLL